MLSLTDNPVAIVTHVECPSLFYCRWEKDQDKFEELNQMIKRQVNDYRSGVLIRGRRIRSTPILPNHNPETSFLIYSAIHNNWCRGRLLAIKMVDQNLKPSCVKVWLIDYGSIEFVSWKPEYIASSTSEIDNFNNGQGLCFPCSLYNIKPGPEPLVENQNLNTNQEHIWTSYANFMFKKEASNNKFRLKLHGEPSETNQNTKNDIIVCDLFPFETTNQQCLFSLSDFLVKCNVAQYVENI